MGGPALDEGTALFDRVAPALPVLLANLVSLGEIAVTYRSDIEQLLVLFPQGTAVMSAIVARELRTPSRTTRASTSTSTSTSTCRRPATPDSCRSGSSVRRPTSTTPERPAGELYCRVPQDSTLNVRGVRNIPCENNPGQAGADGRDVRKQRAVRPAQRRLQLEGRPERDAVRSGRAAVCAGPGSAAAAACGHGCRSAARRTATGRAPAPPPVAFAPIRSAPPASYIGPDGNRYTQADLAHPGNKTWQSMLIPPAS